MSATAEGVLIVSNAGVCEYANDAASRLLRMPLSEILASPVHPILHPDGHDLAECQLVAPVWEGLNVQHQEDWWPVGESSGLPVLVSVSPLVENGTVSSAVIMFSDYSVQARQNRAQAQARDALEQSVRRMQQINEFQTDFVYTVSHELRTPLTSIMGFTEIALEHDLPEGAREALSVVDRNARRLFSQVEDLLMASRIEAGTLSLATRTVDVGSVLRSVTESIGPQANTKDIVTSPFSDGDC